MRALYVYPLGIVGALELVDAKVPIVTPLLIAQI
jgi:hypothetical protein